MSASSYGAVHYRHSAASWRSVRLPFHHVIAQGKKSREKRIPFDACPYTEEPNRTFWQRGWKGEPVSQREAAELQQKAAEK